MLRIESMRRSRKLSGLAAALLAFALLAAGCGNPIRNKIESHIEAVLSRLIGPAKSYTVSVSGSTMGMMNGKLRITHIVGRDVMLPSGIMVSELDVVSHGIKIDENSRQISNVDDTTYSATLGQDALDSYLCETYRQVPNLKAELMDGLIRITAGPELGGLQVHITADAALKVKDNRYLILDLKDVRVAGVGTPALAREYLESRINPVFDSASFGYDAKINKVSIKPGGLTVEGTLDLAKQLNVVD